MSNARFLKNVICVFDIHIKRIFFCRSQVVLLVRDLSQLRNILGWACTAYTSEPLLQFLQISCLNIFVQLHIFSTADNILLVLHNSSFTNCILHLKRKIQTSYTITKENMTKLVRLQKQYNWRALQIYGAHSVKRSFLIYHCTYPFR